MLKQLVQSIVGRRLDSERISRHLDKSLPKPTAPGRPKSTGKIMVSCVQREITPVRSANEYADLAHAFVCDAATTGSRLVVFPEYNFFDLFGLIPGFHTINRRLNAQAQHHNNPDHPGDENRGSAGSNALFLTLVSAMAKPAETAILTIMSRLAKAYQLYIYTGSYLREESDGLYNTGSLIGPDGIVIGTQQKLHLTDAEAEMGFCRNSALQVFELDIGRVAIPICMDATYFETFRLLRNLGAEVAVLPIANQEEYNQWKAMRGIWPRVQESYLFGLKASLNGWVGGMYFSGRAGVFAPLDLTERGDGVLAISDHYEGNALVTAELDLCQLNQARQEAEYSGDLNPAFEANYYLETYARGIVR